MIKYKEYDEYAAWHRTRDELYNKNLLIPKAVGKIWNLYHKGILVASWDANKDIGILAVPVEEPVEFKQKMCYMVDYNDLEDVIEAKLGRELEIPCDLESSNDVAYTFDLTDPISYDENMVNSWLNDGDEWYVTGDLLSYMASMGMIPKGYYVMEVCW